MLVGVIARKTRYFSDDSDRILSNLLVKFTLPGTVFMSMLRPFTRELLAESLQTIVIMTGVFLFGLFLAKLLSRLLPSNSGEKRIWQFALMFPNVTYIGFPLIYSVYGNDGMLYASMVTIVFNILAFSIGVDLLSIDKKSQSFGFRAKRVFLAPSFVAVFIGFIFFVTGWRLPGPVENGVGLIGSMTTPIAMLMVGSLLCKTIQENGVIALVKDWRVYPIITVRLIILPVIVFLVLSQFIENSIMLGTLVMLSAMPAAALTAIFAKQYGGDTNMAVKIVSLCDALCLLTVPFLSLILFG